jgi:23S rRNA pseudouridine2605 synthase
VEERLQKFLARCGVASRRASEELIVAGRVSVNGEVVTVLGSRIDPERDQVAFDGEPVRPVRRHTYVLVHKPRRMLTTTRDPRGRATVMELVRGIEARLVPVGRLDWDAEGVLLLTDDTGLAHELLHPSRHIPKTYLVKARGLPDAKALEALARGVPLEDGKTAPAGVELVRTTEHHAWVRITLYEGRNQQVKRMFAAVGHPVLKLKRERFAGLSAQDLPPGAWRHLTEAEVTALRSLTAGTRLEPRAAKRRDARSPVRRRQAPIVHQERPSPRGSHPRDRRDFGPPGQDERGPPRARDDHASRTRRPHVRSGPPRRRRS